MNACCKTSGSQKSWLTTRSECVLLLRGGTSLIACIVHFTIAYALELTRTKLSKLRAAL